MLAKGLPARQAFLFFVESAAAGWLVNYAAYFLYFQPHSGHRAAG